MQEGTLCQVGVRDTQVVIKMTIPASPKRANLPLYVTCHLFFQAHVPGKHALPVDPNICYDKYVVHDNTVCGWFDYTLGPQTQTRPYVGDEKHRPIHFHNG